jgi:aspartyl-tRNA(Asn)/glutamyl-tRNA(Gln) amidotransferase subunit A
MLSAAEIAPAVRSGELDPVELIEAHLQGIEELRAINAVVTTCDEQAVARARGSLGTPLTGVPLLVKDLLDTTGVRTTYGSRIYENHIPRRTAWAVERLERAGAIVIGKANLHEFAWGTTSQNPHFGYVGNPVFPGYVAGGSSGGNAAALAANVSVLGLGTDTAGSVRIPSACCGTVGLKPPHGAVPTAGCMPLSPTLDTVGPMTRTVADCALAYSVLTGIDIPQPRIDGLVIGAFDRRPTISTLEPGSAPVGAGSGLEEIVRTLERLGAHVQPAEIPDPEVDLVPIMLSEAAAAHRETFPARRDQYGPDTQVKWDAANAVPAGDVAAARRELLQWRERVNSSSTVDLYVSETLAGPIPEITVWEPDVRLAMIGNTRTFSLLGWPAIAVGNLQFAGPDPATVLAAALAWEAALAPVPRGVPAAAPPSAPPD